MFFRGKCGPYNWYKYDNSEIIFEWVWVCAGVALLALLTPVLAKQNVWIIFAVRLVQVIMINIRQYNQIMSWLWSFQHVAGWTGGIRLPITQSHVLSVGAREGEVCFPQFCVCRWNIWFNNNQPHVWRHHRITWLGGIYWFIYSLQATQPHFSRLCSMWLEESA